MRRTRRRRCVTASAIVPTAGGCWGVNLPPRERQVPAMETEPGALDLHYERYIIYDVVAHHSGGVGPDKPPSFTTALATAAVSEQTAPDRSWVM